MSDIERVAQALRDQGGLDLSKYEARHLAEIAIKAMRDPSDAAINAGLDRLWELNQAGTSSHYTLTEVFQSMIDAAITNGKP